MGWALIWSGVFIFGYLGWQLYVTDWLNAGVQREATTELTGILAAANPDAVSIDPEDFLGGPPPEGVPGTVEHYPEDPAGMGEAFGFLSIPRIGVDRVVVHEGVDTGTLRKGPGHMPTTPLPGQPGNSVVSGHRTTYGRPFFDLDLLAEGDRIEVETSTGTHVYEVRDLVVVAPTEVWVAEDRSGGWLTLTTCHPKFSARERLVVFAEMVGGPNLDYVELDKAREEDLATPDY